jgi:hypothetical protein
MRNETTITSADVVIELTQINDANSILVKLPALNSQSNATSKSLRQKADEAVLKMKTVRLRDSKKKNKSMGEYNRGFGFTRTELENLIEGAKFPDNFLGIQICLGIHEHNPPLTFPDFAGKPVKSKLDCEIFPVVSLITDKGMSAEMYAPVVKGCIEVAGIKCPPLMCPPPPPPPGG